MSGINSSEAVQYVRWIQDFDDLIRLIPDTKNTTVREQFEDFLQEVFAALYISMRNRGLYQLMETFQRKHPNFAIPHTHASNIHLKGKRNRIGNELNSSENEKNICSVTRAICVHTATKEWIDYTMNHVDQDFADLIGELVDVTIGGDAVRILKRSHNQDKISKYFALGSVKAHHCQEYDVELWNLSETVCRGSFLCEKNPFGTIVVAPQSRTNTLEALSGPKDRTLFIGHQKSITCVQSFGQGICTTSLDGSIKLWMEDACAEHLEDQSCGTVLSSNLCQSTCHATWTWENAHNGASLWDCALYPNAQSVTKVASIGEDPNLNVWDVESSHSLWQVSLSEKKRDVMNPRYDKFWISCAWVHSYIVGCTIHSIFFFDSRIPASSTREAIVAHENFGNELGRISSVHCLGESSKTLCISSHDAFILIPFEHSMSHGFSLNFNNTGLLHPFHSNHKLFSPKLSAAEILGDETAFAASSRGIYSWKLSGAQHSRTCVGKHASISSTFPDMVYASESGEDILDIRISSCSKHIDVLTHPSCDTGRMI